MSIFGKIKDAIFGRQAEAATHPTPAPQPGTAPASGPAITPGSSPEPAPASPNLSPAPTANAGATPGTTSPAPAGASAPVDVEAIMDKAVADSGQTLHWRKSIVDMMKALHLDSSLGERKELAAELGYSGDMNDSATMNVWLHKALLKKLAENGGKVPAELTD